MSISAGPHYEVLSTELARWLERLGTDRWWLVDGDPLLSGRLSIPCPADELAAELDALARPLLVEAKSGDSEAKGQRIGAAQLDKVVSQYKDDLRTDRPMPDWAEGHFFYMCWKGSPHEWLLAEDVPTTELMRAEAEAAQSE